MDTINESNVEIQPLSVGWHSGKVAALDMLRLDALHPMVSGNKWYKLKHNMRYAVNAGFRQVLTFGGGYSNHLVATAAAAGWYGLPSTGVVRGIYPHLTPTLETCQSLGMKLIFTTKEDYRQEEEPLWQRDLTIQFDETLIIPEGGANVWGREGAQDIAALIGNDYTHICLPVGTGTTLAGIHNGLPAAQQVIGFVPMKGGVYIKDHISAHVQNQNFTLFDDWHFGGFGKWNDELIDFMNSFYNTNAIPLDVVYTSKMMYGIQALLQQSYFPADARVLCLHTGGLQGNAAVQPRLLYS